MKIIYCCKDCGDKISYNSAIYGKGRCNKCSNIEIWNNPNFKESMSKIATKRFLGHKVSLITRKKISKANKGRERPHVSIKLQKYTELQAIQNGRIHRWKKWLQFREYILKRDNYICNEFGCKNKADTIHHKQPKKKYPELCWVASNVISLCTACHCKIEKPSLGKI